MLQRKLTSVVAVHLFYYSRGVDVFVCVLPRKDVWRKDEATIKVLLTQEIQISKKKKPNKTELTYPFCSCIVCGLLNRYSWIFLSLWTSCGTIFSIWQWHLWRKNLYSWKTSAPPNKTKSWKSKWRRWQTHGKMESVKQMTKIYLEQTIISLSTNNILIWREVALRYSHLSSLLAARGEGRLRFGPKTSILLT